MLSQGYNIIIDCVVSAPVHGREVFDEPNSTVKRFIFRLMATVQLPGYKYYYTHISMHSSTHSSDVVTLAQYINTIQCLM